MCQTVESNPFRMLHAGFHGRETRQDRTKLLGGLAVQGHQVDADLAYDGLDLAEIGAGRADVGVQLLDVDVELIDGGLDLADVAMQERLLGAELFDMGAQLDDLRLQLGQIGLELAGVGPGLADDAVDAVGHLVELAADKAILPVATVDIGIFGQDGGTDLEDFGVEVTQTVVDMEESGIGDGDGDGWRGGFTFQGHVQAAAQTAHARSRPVEASIDAGHRSRTRTLIRTLTPSGGRLCASERHAGIRGGGFCIA